MFDEQHTGYGIQTDSSGQFSADFRSPHGFTWMYLCASAPNDDYGHLQTHAHNVVIKTEPIPTNRLGEPWLRYKDFRASIVFSKKRAYENFHFLRGRW